MHTLIKHTMKPTLQKGKIQINNMKLTVDYKYTSKPNAP